jgi:hypothetical protein
MRTTFSCVVNRLLVCVLAAMLIGAAGGCYKRVVGVEGVGADRYDVYQPNLKDPDESALPKRQTVPTQTVPSKRAPG